MRKYEMILTCLFTVLIFSNVKANDHGVINGRITWDGGYGFIEGAAICAYNLDGKEINSVLSDQNGFYSLELPAGDFLISAEKWNMVKEYYPGEYLQKNADPITVFTGQAVGINFALDAGGWISGQMGVSGDEVQSGLITAIKIDEPYQGWYKSIRIDGPFPSAYALSGLLPGTYKILARARGKRTEYYPGVDNIDEATAISVARDVGVSGISIILDQVGWGSIEGRVFDQSTGSGITGIVLYAYQWSNFWEDPNLVTAITTDNGRYHINIPAGNYLIFALYAGPEDGDGLNAIYYYDRYDPTTADIITVSDNQIQQGIDFPIDFLIRHDLLISGTIFSEYTGQGLDNIVVTAIESQTGIAVGSAYSANNGKWQIGGLAPGDYRVMFSSTNIIPYFYPQTPNWQGAEVITLQRHFGDIRTEAITQDYGNMGLLISGHVSSPSGPLEGARIYAFHENDIDPSAYAISDQNGHYEIVNGLRSGAYVLKCDFYGYNYLTFPDTLYLDLALNPDIENVDFTLTNSASAVNGDIVASIPFEIMGNYPNPFNSSTLLQVYSGSSTQFSSKISAFNILGELTGQRDITLKPGLNLVEWSASDFRSGATSGLYFLKIDNLDRTHRVIYLK
jgi:hypothetical protein